MWTREEWKNASDSERLYAGRVPGDAASNQCSSLDPEWAKHNPSLDPGGSKPQSSAQSSDPIQDSPTASPNTATPDAPRKPERDNDAVNEGDDVSTDERAWAPTGVEDYFSDKRIETEKGE